MYSDLYHFLLLPYYTHESASRKANTFYELGGKKGANYIIYMEN